MGYGVLEALIGPFAAYSTYTCCFFGTPALFYIRYTNPLDMKLRGSLVRGHTNTTTRSVGSFEALRLEVVRLAPPLLLFTQEVQEV